MATALENKALLEEIYEAFFTGDLEKWFGYIDDNSALIEAQSLPYAGEHRGPHAIRVAIAHILECWDDGRFDIEDIYSNEGSAIAYGTMHWTARATGKRVSFRLCERWTFNGRRIGEVTPVYGDTALVRTALGLD